MNAAHRRMLFTDPSYPGQRLADPRPEQTRDDRIAAYQRHPIPGQLALFPPTYYVPRADGGERLRQQWAQDAAGRMVRAGRPY